MNMERYSSQAYSDIAWILNGLEEKYLNKLPGKLIEFFEDNKDPFYISSIDIMRPLAEQELSQETEAILCLLNLNYWCTPEEKEKLMAQYEMNEKEYQEELRKKYKIDNLFDTVNKNIEPEPIEQTSMVVVKEKNIFMKIIDKIKNIFKFR